MPLKSKMDYAIKLADLEIGHIYEDLYKLACLCEEIEDLKSNGYTVNPDTEAKYNFSIKMFYQKNGEFRSEIELKSRAKQFIHSIN